MRSSFCCHVLCAGVAISLDSAGLGTKPTPGEKTVRLASLTLKDDYPEGTSAAGLFGEIAPHLRELSRLEKVAGR